MRLVGSELRAARAFLFTARTFAWAPDGGQRQGGGSPGSRGGGQRRGPSSAIASWRIDAIYDASRWFPAERNEPYREHPLARPVPLLTSLDSPEVARMSVARPSRTCAGLAKAQCAGE
jgi:hypothetical protein